MPRMTSPFGLSSSVGYSKMGRDNGWLRTHAQVRVGMIAIFYGPGGWMTGGGPDGHTAVVNALPGPDRPDIPWDCIETMESRGHVGPCFMIRKLHWWREFVEVPGVTPARLESMRALTRRCIAAGIGYSALGGNRDNDSLPDRADLGDYQHPTGKVDCSGDVFDLFDCAWQEHPTTDDEPPPAPPPIYVSEEDDVMPSLHYPPQHQTHTCWRGTKGKHEGHLMHTWRYDHAKPLGVEDLFLMPDGKIRIPEFIPVGAPISGMVDPVGLDMVWSVPVNDGALLRVSWLGTAGPWAFDVAGR